MRIAVFGLGHVGCVTAACLARGGHHVWGVDVNSERVRIMNNGRSPVVEPGLADVIAQTVAERRLSATTEMGEALDGAHVALICVGTSRRWCRRLDVERIDHVARGIRCAMGPRAEPLTIVLRSAVLPGTTRRALRVVIGTAPNGAADRVRVAFNPDFMRRGSSMTDFGEPPMILVGADDPAAAALVRTLYIGIRAPFIHTSISTAELVKFAATVYHGFTDRCANELTDLGAALGADAGELVKILAMDRRPPNPSYGWTSPRRMA